jgi:hypothetical protein
VALDHKSTNSIGFMKIWSSFSVDFIEGVIRWHNRVGAYAFLLITDRYPPCELRVTSICHGCKQGAEGDVVCELGNER